MGQAHGTRRGPYYAYITTALDQTQRQFGRQNVLLPCHHVPLGFNSNQTTSSETTSTETASTSTSTSSSEPLSSSSSSSANEEGQQQPEPAPFRGLVPPSWEQIRSVLTRKITNVSEFYHALKELSPEPPNIKYFTHNYGNVEAEAGAHFFGAVLPFIQELALRLPQLFPADQPLPLLLPQHNIHLTLTQEQVACLLANTFFCTLWAQPADFLDNIHFPELDFTFLYKSTSGPTSSVLTCIIHYFDRIRVKMPQGRITYRRQVLSPEQTPDWANSTKKITKMVAIEKGCIEDSKAVLHADFANEFIGGGVLHGGCVQEEILFAIKPECLVSLLFCAKMDANEVIIIKGAERFSSYRGYGHSFQFDGNYNDQTPRDEDGHIRTEIVAMDAIVSAGDIQWQPHNIERDLNKAYAAFFVPNSEGELPAVATGNWGCGAFGGDKALKTFQQLLAASEAGREVLYFTFGENYQSEPLSAQIQNLIEICHTHHLTVGDVYKFMRAAPTHRPNLFKLFKAQFSKKEISPKASGEEAGVTGGRQPNWEGNPNQIFLGNLPFQLHEDDVKSIVTPFGPLKSFTLTTTANSESYALFEYMDPTVTDQACSALTGLVVAGKSLRAHRASLGATQSAQPTDAGDVHPMEVAGDDADDSSQDKEHELA